MQKLITAIAAALFVTVGLKGLHAFHLIKWNPIQFLKKIETFNWTTFACWMVLFFLLIAVTYLLLSLFRLFQAPFSVSLIFGLIIALVVEWQVRNLPIEWHSLQKLSLPFFVLLLISMRFLTETAHSMRK